MDRDQEFWRRFVAALAVPQPPASEAFVSRVMARIPEAAPAPGYFSYRWLVPVFGVAAAAFALLFVTPGPDSASAEALLLAVGDGDAATEWLFQSDAPSQADALGSVVTEDL